MAELAYTVYLRDQQGKPAAFGPGDKVPAWAKKLIGKHAYADSDDQAGDEPDPDAGSSGSSDDGPTPPPKGGPGSGTEAWVAYAEALDVAVPENPSRDDVVKAVAAAGHPVE